MFKQEHCLKPYSSQCFLGLSPSTLASPAAECPGIACLWGKQAHGFMWPWTREDRDGAMGQGGGERQLVVCARKGRSGASRYKIRGWAVGGSMV